MTYHRSSLSSSFGSSVSSHLSARSYACWAKAISDHMPGSYRNGH